MAIICTTRIVLVQKKMIPSKISLKIWRKSDYFLLEQYLEHLRPIVAGIVSMDKQNLCFIILSSFV
jgi:hypothetical protein